MELLLAKIEFSRPAVLLLLATVPLLITIAYRSRLGLPLWRRAASGICRSAIVVLLVLAAAGITQRVENNRQFVVFVLDKNLGSEGKPRQAANAFIKESLKHRQHHRTGFISFAEEPDEIRSRSFSASSESKRRASDPAMALLYAAGSIPDGYHRKIVLLSTGRQTAGDLLLAGKGVGMPVLTVPLNPAADDEVSIQQVMASRSRRSNGAFSSSIAIRSNHDDQGEIEFRLDGKLIDTQKVKLTIGENQFSYQHTASAGKPARVEARLKGFRDMQAGNNRGWALAIPEATIRVLLVDGEEQQVGHYRETLTKQGYRVELKSPKAVEANANALAAFDLIVLSDVSAKDMSPPQFAAVDQYVQNGGGLIVLGGEKTYDVNALAGSSLEIILPVKGAYQPIEKETSLAMVLVIDKSASMEEENRIGLAKDGAKRVVGLLGENDLVGVIAYGNDSQWVSEIAPLSNRKQLLGNIDALETEGSTNMYPALERAALALEQAEADSKHVILLTDGVSSPGDFDSLARRMASASVRVSTVSVGGGADQTILADISQIAKGRHRHCDRPEDLADIVVAVARQATTEKPASEFPPVVLRRLPKLKLDSMPPLLGYATTDSKPNVQLLMMSELGHPLLCWWRYGAGVTVAFTSDVKKSGAGRWQKWSDYGRFWDVVARLARRKDRPDNVDVLWSHANGRATIDVDVVDAKVRFLNRAKVEVQIVAPNGKQKTSPMVQVAPGRYRAIFSAVEVGPYLTTVTIVEEDSGKEIDRAARGFSVDYPDELRSALSNHELLKSVAHVSEGIYDPKPETVFESTASAVSRLIPWWSNLVMAAVLLLAVDVVLRRFNFSKIALGRRR